MGRRKLITQKEAELMAKNPTYAAAMFFMIGIALLVGGIYLLKIDDIQVLAALMIVGGVGSFILGIAAIISGRNIKKREEERQRNISKSGMSDIDLMSGREFEYYLHSFYSQHGYKSQMTRTSGDYGADLILTKDYLTTAVQVKHSKNKIGLSAVQEVIGARGHYGTNAAWVITNNYFTKPAIELAQSNNIKLIDRDGLAKQIVNMQTLNQRDIASDSETEE